MSPATTHRNADGILSYMKSFMKEREQQAARINTSLASFISDITWVQLESLRQVLTKAKAFGGEKHVVADVLAGSDDLRKKALLGTSDQNSILYEIINSADETNRKVSDMAIHDMRTYFRALDPSLEGIVTLIQHWIVWDLPDASDLHYFDEQERRIQCLCGIEMTEELRSRYRAVLHKMATDSITNEEVFRYEIQRMEGALARFKNRRCDDEPYQVILSRGEDPSQEPVDYKESQVPLLTERIEEIRSKVSTRMGKHQEAT